jgi:hypothetical protein
MNGTDSVGIILFIFLQFLGPSVLFAYFGWRLARKLKGNYRRIVLRSAILSFAFAPTIYGHAGPIFASWVVLLAPLPDKLSYGFLPIIVV